MTGKTDGSCIEGRGDFIDGAFEKGEQRGTVESFDPARDFAPVFVGGVHKGAVDAAVAAAKKAQKAWAALGIEGRLHALDKLKDAFNARVDEMARAIVHETGKVHREGLGEAKALGARVDLMASDGLLRISALEPVGVNGRARAHAQGVLGVIGPYNYPAHLINAHVIPALMTGNTVVIKPSETCPHTGELYAQCALDAGLPPGVLNLVQGGGDVGGALVAHPDVDGILFTGSWATGRKITEACLDQPNKIVALEMGGKNCAVVLDDADLSQALAAILQGAYLSAGQRCTATSRVLIEKGVADPFIEALTNGAAELLPGDPWAADTAFGPLSNRPAFERFQTLRAQAKAAGCEVLVEGKTLDGGAFVSPSVHLLADAQTEAPGYLDEELFGPDICVEVVDDLDHAIARINAQPYGLSNALFSASEQKFERLFIETKSGLLNKNRSTNGASGKLPFGGVGKSGNQRPAGIDAVRYTTFPVAIIEGAPGEIPVDQTFAHAFSTGDEALSLDLDHLLLRHELEGMLERHRIAVDDVRGPDVFVCVHDLSGLFVHGAPLDAALVSTRLEDHVRTEGEHVVFRVPPPAAHEQTLAFFDRVSHLLDDIARENPRHLLGQGGARISLPVGGELPRSDRMLRRMYRRDFVPKERKTPVVDLSRSEGPYLSSIDNTPLTILDAASQIASLGLGFQPGAFWRALDEGELGPLLVANPDTTVTEDAAVNAYADFLLSRTWSGLQHATFAAGGAEANERAFDLCRLNGPGGRRVIAFEGSFHGRTMVSLHATYNPVKRAPFEFAGYEARYVPFPRWTDPREEPPVTDAWVKAWSNGHAPSTTDALEQSEIDSLLALKAAVEEGDACAVIVEPMQGEGGDNYATARFFNGLRALTRHLRIPLIFDEVQMGFGTGGPFFWHTRFSLRDQDGNADGPDCVTTAKKAQVGVCLSAWEDPRPAPAHAAQALRGHLHASGIIETDVLPVETQIQRALWALAVDFPLLVENPRCQGVAFAVDLPSQHLAMQFVAQRFYRGMMVYIAGERTIRFRLNAAWTRTEIDTLFGGIRDALMAIAELADDAPAETRRAVMEAYKAPAWIDGSRVERGRARSDFLDEYEALSEDPVALLEWLLGLPRAPLERVCDRVLAAEGQLDDRVVEVALERLTKEIPPRPKTVLAEMEAHLAKLHEAADTPAAYRALHEELGLDPARVVVEALGARVVQIGPRDWETYREGVMAIENVTYEAGRRETEDEIEEMVDGPGSISLLLVRATDAGKRVLGYAFGGPVENFHADGPAHDPYRDQKNTFYSSNITLAPDVRGAGLGARLKRAQVMAVRALEGDDQQKRYDFITGRNRVHRTLEMGAINRAFGAYTARFFKGNQYGDLSGEAAYYRVPLRRPHLAKGALPAPSVGGPLDWASSVQAPLGKTPPSLVRALERGEFNNAVGTKLTLSNWVTPDLVRYTELLSEIAPRGLPHAYFTSGRAELVDKGLRCLRVNRPEGQMVIGLERQFLGTTTAAARSLTDDDGQAQPFGWFDWPKIPHPAEVGDDASIGALMALVQQLKPEKILGVIVELVGEKSGLVVPPSFMDALADIHRDTGIPVVAVETASALGRGGQSLFLSDTLTASPNMVWWYTGAQLGHIFADDKHFVKKPLTLISTWDGDEICCVRNRHHVIEARALLAEGRAERFENAFKEAGLSTAGRGLWQVFDVGDAPKADAAIAKAKDAGLLLGRGLAGRVVACPPLSVSDDEMQRGVAILKDTLSGRGG